MSKKVLSAIADTMAELGLNYEYMEWTKAPDYPYWVGEYQEVEPLTESGLMEATFILTGFTRGKYSELEDDKQAIENSFHPIYGKRASFDDGTVVTLLYAATLSNMFTGDAELKKIQINITVNEWKVN